MQSGFATKKMSQRKSWSLFTMMRARFTRMMGKGGCVVAGKQPIRPKGQGRGIMVSDFIDEYNGFLPFSDQEYEEARARHTDLWKNA